MAWFGEMSGSNPDQEDEEVECYPENFVCDTLTSNYFMECDPVELDWHETINSEGYELENTCAVVAKTDGGNCATWCEN
jgi:hypothetical protein